MTTTPPDPFGTPQQPQGHPSPGAVPPPRPPLSSATLAPEAPTTLGTWVLITTGATTGLTALSSLGVRSQYEALSAGGGTATAVGPAELLGTLANGAWIASYIVLCLWMMRVYQNMVQQGYAQPLPVAFVWVGWIIPLAWYVLPAMAMRGLNATARSWALWPWWLSFCAYWTAGFAVGIAAFGAIDWDAAAAGETENIYTSAGIDSMVTLTYLSTVLLIVSYAFLVPLVRDITKGHIVQEPGTVA